MRTAALLLCINRENLAMLSRTTCAWLLAAVGISAIGCGSNPFRSPQSQSALQQQPAYGSQLQELQRRVAELDTSNRDLHAKLAQAEQQVAIYRDQSGLLQKQLADTAEKYRQSELAQTEAKKQVEAFQASVRRRGGATITANNSVQQSLSMVQIPGVDVRQQQDVIRIALPADALFQRGTAQLLPTAYAYLDKVADAIARNYPRQRVAIEGHTDSGPVFTGMNTTAHQLSSLQALGVFDVLTRRNHLPARQMFVEGMGANYPIASNATEAGRAKNRRIEIVVYPQSLD